MNSDKFREKKRKRWLGLLSFLMVLCFAQLSFAQTIGDYASGFSQSMGTYSPLTGETVLWEGYDGFDTNSTTVTLTSPFNYLGVDYTDIYVNSDGYILFGSGATSGYPVSSGKNGVSAFAADLDAKAASAGTALPSIGWKEEGNEVIFQWENLARWTGSGASSAENLKFQIRLNKSNSEIKIVYGNCTDRATAITSPYPQVGLGNTTSSYSNRTIAAGGGDWINSAAGTAAANTMAFNGATKPSNGLTFKWTLPTCVAPGGLLASSITTNSANLGWTSAGNNFDIKWGTSGFNFATEGTLVTGQTNPYSLGGLSPATAYQFYVRQNCGGGDLSQWAGPFSFSTVCEAPNAPTALVFSNVTATGTTVGYTAPETTPTGYTIFRSTSNIPPVLANGTAYTSTGLVNSLTVEDRQYYLTSSTTSLSASVSGLTANTQYYYYVYSRNCTGATVSYSATPLTGTMTTSSAAPTAFTSNNITFTTADVSWTAPAAGGGAGIYTYSVEVATDSGFTNQIAGSPFNVGTGVTYNLTGLNHSTTYYVRVKANNGYSDSAYLTGNFTTGTPGQIGSGTTTIADFPISTNWGYNYTQQIYTQAQVSAALDPENNYITKIKFFWNGTTTNATPSSSNTLTTTANCDNWVVYLGNTDQASFATTSSWIPVGNLQKVFEGDVTFPTPGNWMEIEFTTPFIWDTTKNLVVTVSEREHGYPGTSYFRSFTSGSNTAMYVRTDSAPGTVTDPLAPGAGTQSNIINQIRLEATTPPNCLPVSGINVSNVTAYTAQVQWSGNDDYYELEYGVSGFTQGTGTLLSDTDNPTTIHGLTPETNYHVYVRQICGGTPSPWMGPISFTTTIACPAPTALTATNITNNSAVLGWTSTGTSFDIEWGLEGSTPTGTPQIIGTSNPYNLGGLQSSTNYWFYVRQNCSSVGDGVSVWAGPFTFTTECEPPLITNSTGDQICGQGNVTLSVETDAAVVNWYTSATGGDKIGTGTSFDSFVSETTSFYAEAANPISGVIAQIGTTTTSSTSSGNSPYYHGYGGAKTQYIYKAEELIAAGISAGEISSIAFETTTAGASLQNFTVHIGTTTQSTATTTHVSGLSQVYANANQAIVVGVNTYNFTTPFIWDGESNLVVQTCYSNNNGGGTSSSAKYHTSSILTTYTYADYRTAEQILNTMTGSVSSSGGTYTVSNRANILINGTGLCASPRTEVIATVSSAPSLAISESTIEICNGETSAAVTITEGASSYDTYVWTPSTGVTGDASTGWTFNPTEDTTYTLTASQSAGAGCASSTTVTVNVNKLPLQITIAGLEEICENQITELTSGFNISGTAVFGNGTTAPSTTSFPNPLSAYYGGAKHQILFRASEIQAQGLIAGSSINAITFDLLAYVAKDCNDLTIRMGHTTVDALSGFVTGTTNVYGPQTFTPSTTGIVTFTLNTPFVWDGVSNIVVETVHNAGNGGNGSGTRTKTTTTSFNSVYYGASDNIAGGISGFDNLTTYNSYNTSTSRPNMTFVHSLVETSITWSPATNLYTDAQATVPYVADSYATTVYYKPTASGTATYTATSYNEAGCSISDEITITNSSLKSWIGTTNTNWNEATNWCGNTVPSTSSNVVIASDAPNYPVISSDVTIGSLSVENGASLTVNSNTLTVGAINVATGGTMTVKSGATLWQAANTVNTGNVTIQRNVTLKHLDYTIWSSPVVGQALQAFSPNTLPNRIRDYVANTWVAVPNVNANFTPGKGYMFRAPNVFDPEFYPNAYTWTGSFTGVPQTADEVVVPFTVAANHQSVGNPYPTAIDADLFYTENDAAFANNSSADVLGAMYIWMTDRSDIAATGGDAWALYNPITGGTNPGGGTPHNGIIPAGQGFLLRTRHSIAQLPSVKFTTDMRIAATGTFYRNASPERHRLWLNLANQETVLNQTLVAYVEGATQGFDASIDAEALSNNGTALYSLVDNNTNSFMIQGRALPFNDLDVVPMGFRAANAGTYTISLANFDGVFADGQDIFLVDALNQVTHNLKEANYTFVSEAGEFNSRFSVVYRQDALSVTNPDLNNNWVVYPKNGQFQIETLGFEMKQVIVYDMLGRTVYQSKADGNNHLVDAINANQVLIVKVVTTDNVTLTKKVNN